MTMADADIWLTAAAEAAFSELQSTAPQQAAAVAQAIDDIPSKPGRPLNVPGARSGEPFLAIEPGEREAPAVIYRHATGEEQGKWLVVALMNRDDYRATLRAERELGAYPPVIQNLVRNVIGTVAGTVATMTNTPSPLPDPNQGRGAVPTTGTGTPQRP